MRRKWKALAAVGVVGVLVVVFSVGAAAQEGIAEIEPEPTWEDKVNGVFDVVVGLFDSVLFWGVPVPFYTGEGVTSVPLVVLVLFLGGIFFTLRYGFVSIRLFVHSIYVILGRYDNPEDEGEITHFQALSSALAATVGLGNIAGVAVAISAGGPGAVFWMWMTAIIGMSTKFSSCTLAQMYRRIQPDGHTLGGPMVYLEDGIKELYPRLAPVGKIFAVAFAFFTITASLGAGNLFQGNQTYAILAAVIPAAESTPWLPWAFGLGLAFLVGIVIIGGIRRIGEVTSKMVPGMCAFYVAICIVIVAANLSKVPGVFTAIFSQALTPDAMYGGFLGVMIWGMKRALFSNEAGLGSSAIAHAAAKTDEPVREGVVAMIEPFIDTLVVCSMTALVILITGADTNGQGGSFLEGAVMTSRAFASLHPVLAYFLVLAAFVFAYSSIITWGYYGERATESLAGRKGIVPYRIVYVAVVVFGPVLSLRSVVDFSDMALLCMTFPNIIGMVLISGKVRSLTRDYIRRLRTGEMKPRR